MGIVFNFTNGYSLFSFNGGNTPVVDPEVTLTGIPAGSYEVIIRSLDNGDIYNNADLTLLGTTITGPLNLFSSGSTVWIDR